MKKILLTGLIILISFSIQSCVVHTRAPQTKVVYVKKAPKNHRIVVVKGKKYYYWGGKHYRKTPRGYVVVRVR